VNHIRTTVILAVTISAGTARADAVTNRDDLGADDNIQWGQFGPPDTIINGPAEGLTDGGLAFTVDDGDHALLRLDQSDGWNGNFSPGEELIWSGDFVAPIEIDFDRPVFGVGANIQKGNFGMFDGVIEVFDGDENLIERFSREGDSNDNADGSAIFIGILSDTPIARATFYAGSSGAAINMVGLVTIPAPSGLALLAGAGLIASRRRR